ncbi:MAG: DMT family transporter [Anaerotardibacter sp.]
MNIFERLLVSVAVFSFERSVFMVWVLLLVSICFEVFADTSMKLSEGFKKKPWIIGIVVGYAVSFSIMSIVLMTLPLGITYAIWSSLAIVLTAFVSRLVWKEKFNSKKVIGMVLIVVGIVLLRLGA